MNQLDMTTPEGIALGLLPEILLTGWSLVVLLVASWRHETPADSRLAGWLSFAGVVLSSAGLGWLWVNDVGPLGLAQMIALDPFRYAGLALVLLSAAATILLSLGYLERERLLAEEQTLDPDRAGAALERSRAFSRLMDAEISGTA